MFASRAATRVAFAVSFALHAALLAWVWTRTPARPRTETVTVDITETVKPPPPQEPPKAKPLPKAIKKFVPAAPLPVRHEPPPPLPPNQPPPAAQPPPHAQTIVHIGITMSSTSSQGSFAVPVGNSLYGKPPDKAADPESVKPYASPKYVAATQVSAMPEPIETNVPKNEYPPEALRLGFAGDVVLKLYVDETGRVSHAAVVKDPGNGLGEAAVHIAQKYFRFKPAYREGQAVATEIPFTVHFELP